MTGSVAFVGPLPPPVHGFSYICSQMLDLLQKRTQVCVFDRAPAARPWSVLRQLVKPLRYFAVCLSRRNVALYLALSGGFGQAVDFAYVLVSKLFGGRVFVHHHSFAYINSPSLLSRCLLSLLRRDTHIVLSAQMGASLAGLYGLNSDGVTVVSNAAF